MLRLLLSFLALISGLAVEARAVAAPVAEVGVVRMVGVARLSRTQRAVAPGLAVAAPAPVFVAPLALLPAQRPLALAGVVLKADRAHE